MFEILFPLAGAAADEAALARVLAMARLLDAKVHLVRVLESRRISDRPIDPVDWHVKKQEAEAALDSAAQVLHGAGIQTEQVLLEGDPTEHLVNYARRQSGASMVLLLGAPQRGDRSGAGGEVLWRSYLTTVLLRDGPGDNGAQATGFQRVLVALDGSKRAECVLPWVQVLAEQGGAEIVLAHVVLEPELPRLTPATEQDLELVRRLIERNRHEASSYLEGVRNRLAAPSETRLVQGRKVFDSLQEVVQSEGIDMVVLSAHGYGGESRWPFGEVATSFIDHGRTPLLLVQDMQKEGAAPVGVTSESWGG